MFPSIKTAFYWGVLAANGVSNNAVVFCCRVGVEGVGDLIQQHIQARALRCTYSTNL